jgi:hypothetical protein
MLRTERSKHIAGRGSPAIALVVGDHPFTVVAHKLDADVVSVLLEMHHFGFMPAGLGQAGGFADFGRG